ncbi:MAG: lipopolysaccharide heptosyltransferase I [Magnetococcales bacterium]|nr:lipopolysaccharide heptosyltransferase I [Magnetococcales bacterium]
MNILLVKTSSLGDVVHTLPAVTDAARSIPGCRFHWVVEESLAEIPTWHPAVEAVIVFPWRRWRRRPLQAWIDGEPRRFLNRLRQDAYDIVIDAQGLLKSALPARMGRGPVWGFDKDSAREPLASRCYHHRIAVPKEMHAIERIRHLFSQALNHSLPIHPPDYGLDSSLASATNRGDHVVFIHGTTWKSKLWPEVHWRDLARRLDGRCPILLPWGNETEKRRAETIAAAAPGSARILEKTTLTQLARVIATARGIVTVDTGPAHLAAALSTPAFCLYGPTDPARVGTVCPHHHHHRGDCFLAPCRQRICPRVPDGAPSPCMLTITPMEVEEWLRPRP